MKKRILNYLKSIDELLGISTKNIDWNNAIQEHLIQIQFFQHERLIHLIVTVLFALMTIMTLVGMVISFHPSLIALLVALLILLVPYISHYYLLENGVQKMYEQYDKMLENKKNQEA